ncbi:IS1595 family transposase [Marinilabiliaceae bacterium JC017]|nr:IS1595 family transposase [Marinilabiliaceae bacterium JC017]
MTTKEEILSLFTQLSDTEKGAVLEELNSKAISETILIEDAPILSCPHCESRLFVKNGKRGDLQKYKCKTCCRVFTSRTGTPFHKLQKLDKFEAYKTLMLDGYLPIKKIAEKVGISVQTAFDWRHKILASLGNNNGKFEGITEIDDVWFLYSQKGRKGLDYSRKRGGSNRSGDNDYQAKLLITADRNKTCDFSLVRIGRLKKSDIQRKISGKFSENSTLVSDKHRSIASFAKAEGIEHISFKASEHTAGGEYHVQTVNNMASRLKGIINHSLRGVSTKYLQSYANWFHLKTKRPKKAMLDEMLLQNKEAWNIHKNKEGIYKRFIKTFSRRTYRCPVKKHFIGEFTPEMIAKLKFI